MSDSDEPKNGDARERYAARAPQKQSDGAGEPPAPPAVPAQPQPPAAKPKTGKPQPVELTPEEKERVAKVRAGLPHKMQQARLDKVLPLGRAEGVSLDALLDALGNPEYKRERDVVRRLVHTHSVKARVCLKIGLKPEGAPK